MNKEYYYRGKKLAIIGLIVGLVIFLFTFFYTSFDGLFLAEKKVAEIEIRLHGTAHSEVAYWFNWLFCGLITAICSAITLVVLKNLNKNSSQRKDPTPIINGPRLK